MSDRNLRSTAESPRRCYGPAARRLGLGLLVIAAGLGLGVRLRGVNALAAAASGSLLRNGGMEGRFEGGIAEGWQSNSYGDAVVSFSREAHTHSGRSAQRLHCERVSEGAAQIRQMGLTVRAGQEYTLTLWLRGEVTAPVFVGVRQNTAPYQRYLAQNVRVTPEWQRYVISGTPTADGPDAGVYVAFKSSGDLWIDDVDLREGAPPAELAAVASATRARKGNLLYNSGFELGPDGWGPVARLKMEESGAVQGRTCARCTPNWEPILLESRPVIIRPGQRYTVSANLRASGSTEVEMVVMQYADEGGDRPGHRDAIRQTFRINQEWQRVSLTGVLRAPLVNGYVLQLNLRSGADTVWADALQWEEGELTSYRPAAPVEAAVRTPARLLSPGQPAVTDCRVYLAPDVHAATTVTYRLEDTDGRRVAEQTVSYEASSEQRPADSVETGSASATPPVRTGQLTWKLPRPGIYRVVATPPETPLPRTGQAVFCLLPSGAHRAAGSRLGIHSWSDTTSANTAVKAAAYLGTGEFRLHDFHSFVQWYKVEPTAGKYTWYDADVQDLSRRGYGLLGTLCRAPLWAAGKSDEYAHHPTWSNATPRNWDDWNRYVEAVVGHYRKQIHTWEAWNEPWNHSFWTGTAGEYAQLLSRTRRTIKAADPTATVIGGCFSPAFPQFTAGVLEAGGLSSMDVVSYHDYLTPAKVAEPGEGGEPAFYRSAAALREDIRRNGGHQPLWCTETGVPCPSFYSWLPEQSPSHNGRVAVATLVKGLILLFAAGVDRAYYYHMGGLEWGQGYPSRLLNSAYTLLDYDGSPKPTLPALAQVVTMLGDATDPSNLTTASLRAYAFRHGQEYVAVVWARDAAAPVPLDLTGAGAPTARDAMGADLPALVTVDDRPIYLRASSRAALERAVAADTANGTR